ncbi:MAG: DUF444 family protein [Pseudomonadota bacterium]
MQRDANSGFFGDRDDRWYDLFSRGARDWLRHNEKIRRSVKESLPDLIANADVLTGSSNQRLRVPVRFLEHYRFQLSNAGKRNGVGQGQGKPGDVLRRGQSQDQGAGKGGGGNDEGGLTFEVEFKVDEIVDWLWEELQLPDLKPRDNTVIEEDEWVREGVDKRGARARLDRRRTMKEAIKRRSVQDDTAARFTNDDLRYRMLKRRTVRSTRAAVFYCLDASSSMGPRDRKLAKTFFFWALQGLRRQYPQIETVFVAHTVDAWEFTEDEFFQVQAQGGTVASTCFNKVFDLVANKYPPEQFNLYMFYASDGENFSNDRSAAEESLNKLSSVMNFMGYIEVAQYGITQPLHTETGKLFTKAGRAGAPARSYALNQEEDVWDAIRALFREQKDSEVDV